MHERGAVFCPKIRQAQSASEAPSAVPWIGHEPLFHHMNEAPKSARRGASGSRIDVENVANIDVHSQAVNEVIFCHVCKARGENIQVCDFRVCDDAVGVVGRQLRRGGKTQFYSQSSVICSGIQKSGERNCDDSPAFANLHRGGVGLNRRRVQLVDSRYH